MVQKFSGIPVKSGKRKHLERKTFHRDEPFHLNSPRNSNGKRSRSFPSGFPSEQRFYKLVGRCFQSAYYFFRSTFYGFLFSSPFVDVLFVYALEYAVITFNFSSYFLLSASISCVTFV